MSECLETDADELIARIRAGDTSCEQQLLNLHRDRLRRMIMARMDRRLSARIDASDVIQEAMMEASRKLPEYLRTQPVPYYVWLRKIAWERLVHVHERHIDAQRRAVGREVACRMELSDDSVMELARLIVGKESSPSQNLLRQELRQRVRDALESLDEKDREILVMRFLEQLGVKEIADVLGITPNAATMRQLRALERLRGQLIGFIGDDT